MSRRIYRTSRYRSGTDAGGEVRTQAARCVIDVDAAGLCSGAYYPSEGSGQREVDVAKALGTNVNTVSLWSKRFETGGLEALIDRKGRGRKSWLPPEKVRQVISRVVQPPEGRKKWSTRRMTAEVGISHHSVHRIWRRNDLKPHLVSPSKSPAIRSSRRSSGMSSGCI